VLFGATGDLTARKLVPALYHLKQTGLLPAKVAIVGWGRRDLGDDGFRQYLSQAIEAHVPSPGFAASTAGEAGSPKASLMEFCESVFYHRSTFEDLEGYRSLRTRLEEIETRLGLPGSRLFYLATAPRYFCPIVQLLGEVGLAGADTAAGKWTRVVVEKPVGRDLESATRLNRDLLEVLDEDQIFRIDHYLGKETVQNILALRFANGIFEPLWNQKYVDHVQITVAEDIGVEGRGGYYDTAGALRDMVQNHLLQILTLVAMEPPAAVEADAIRDEKVKVLRAIRSIPPDEVDLHVVRGQYARGHHLGEALSGYLEEADVPVGSRTETYVALRLEIENWRWAGVPFLLRSGKRLPKRTTEVCIQFRKPPLALFEREMAVSVAPNALIMNIQPDEGISLRFGAKVPGPDIRVRTVKMDFGYGSAFGGPSPEAYERLLMDAISGDSTLFTRRDEVEAQWTLIDAIRVGWDLSEAQPCAYEAGSWGPPEADRLLDGAGRSWRRL